MHDYRRSAPVIVRAIPVETNRSPSLSRRGTRGFSGAATALLLAASGSAVAQQQPDAGRILDQLRPQPNLSVPKVPATRIEEPAAPRAQGGEKFPVSRFVISGNSAFSESELLALIADGQGRSLTLGELNELAERITRHYRDRGYLIARALIPPQDVTDGAIRISILEGILGEVEIRNGAGLSASALAPLERLRKGAALDRQALEGSLLALADLPGVDVRSLLRPGTAIGASDLLVEVGPGRGVSGALDFDNQGSRFTGALRAGATVNFNNPFNLGDQIGLGLQTSEEGLRYARVSYQLPVGSYGTRLGVAYSDLHYRLAKDFSALNANGDAQVGSFSVAHPLHRSRAGSVFLNVQWNEKRLVDRVRSTSTETRKTPSTQVIGVSGALQDAWWGGGSTQFSLNHTTGRISLDPVTAALDAASARTQGRFDATSLLLQRNQSLTRELGLFLSLNTQFAGKNLDSSEKFSLGGVNGVRAYPQGEGSADEGRLFSAEVRWTWSETLQAQAFYDQGRNRINRNPFAAGVNERQIWGYGLGVTWAGSPSWLVKGFIAWRGSEQRPASEVDRTPRVWLQARYLF